MSALLVTGCAADSHSSLPGFMRVKEPTAPAQETTPDVPLLVRKNLDTLFVASSQPRDLEVSPALRMAAGDGWTACVRGEITSTTGSALRRQTYRLTIRQNEIIDRRRAAAGDACLTEDYKPVLPTK
jgi:hypothetical protein